MQDAPAPVDRSERELWELGVRDPAGAWHMPSDAPARVRYVGRATHRPACAT